MVVQSTVALKGKQLRKAGPRSTVGRLSDSRAIGPGFDTWSGHILATDSRRAVVSYWQNYVQEVLVNCIGVDGLPRKGVVRLTDCPDMTTAVYRGR